MSEAWFCGVDPGAAPTVCMLSDDSKVTFYEADSVATNGQHRTLANKPLANPPLLLEIFRRYEPVRTGVEWVWVMPKQGVSSQALMVYGMASVYTAAHAYSHNVTYVRPVEWKHYYGLVKKDKEHSRSLVLELFPRLAEFFTRKKDHNRAEALLLAYFIRQRHLTDEGQHDRHLDDDGLTKTQRLERAAAETIRPADAQPKKDIVDELF